MDSLESIPREIYQMVIVWQNLYTRVFFQLCEVGGLRTSKVGLREIWVEVRQQSQTFKESYLALATLKNSLSKYGDSSLFFSQNMVT